MGVPTFDNAAVTQTTTARNTAGLLLTATAGAVLLVMTNVSGNISMSAINVGASQLTPLGALNWGGGSHRAEMWGLTAPPSGVLTISCTIAGGVNLEIGIAGITYVGQNTASSPFGGVTTNSGSATAQTSLIISSTSTNLAIFAYMSDGNVATSEGPGQTRRLQFPSWEGFLITDATGALSITGSATATAAIDFANIGINLIGSAAAAAAWKFSLSQLGVGR